MGIILAAHMSLPTPASQVEIKAATETVEWLVQQVVRGGVRVPEFQRDLRWDRKDVLSLYDSIYRGYPIGALLLQMSDAEAQKVTLGPLTVDAPEMQDALWVVDGQQRLVALAGGLARPTPFPAARPDPYLVYFDAATGAFHSPPFQGNIPSTWVPAPELRDSSTLQEWVFEWEHRDDPGLRKAVFEAAKRLREYKVPLYVIGTDDQDVVRDVFVRMNERGKPLDWKDVHRALYGGKGKQPSTLPDLAEVLADVGMGTPDDELLITGLIASQGLDVTRSRRAYLEDRPEEMEKAAMEMLPAFRSVLSLLRDRAEIPHLLLIPRPALIMPGLIRFFAEFPEPQDRSLTLLSRWVWRVSLGAFKSERRTLQRGSISAVKEDEESSVQRLLALAQDRSTTYEAPTLYVPHSAEARVAILALAAERPLDLETKRPVDVADLIEASGNATFRRVWEAPRRPFADRILAAGSGPAAPDLRALAAAGATSVLASHVIGGEARDALVANDEKRFLELRQSGIDLVVRAFTDRHAAWDHSDRPSILSILSAD